MTDEGWDTWAAVETANAESRRRPDQFLKCKLHNFPSQTLPDTKKVGLMECLLKRAGEEESPYRPWWYCSRIPWITQSSRPLNKPEISFLVFMRLRTSMVTHQTGILNVEVKVHLSLHCNTQSCKIWSAIQTHSTQSRPTCKKAFRFSPLVINNYDDQVASELGAMLQRAWKEWAFGPFRWRLIGVAIYISPNRAADLCRARTCLDKNCFQIIPGDKPPCQGIVRRW